MKVGGAATARNGVAAANALLGEGIAPRFGNPLIGVGMMFLQ
jgi:hypothetical protein